MPQVVPAGGKILVGLRLARSPPELKLLRIIIRLTIGFFFYYISGPFREFSGAADSISDF